MILYGDKDKEKCNYIIDIIKIKKIIRNTEDYEKFKSSLKNVNIDEIKIFIDEVPFEAKTSFIKLSYKNEIIESCEILKRYFSFEEDKNYIFDIEKEHYLKELEEIEKSVYPIVQDKLKEVYRLQKECENILITGRNINEAIKEIKKLTCDDIPSY